MPKITAKMTIDLTIMIQVASTNWTSARRRRDQAGISLSFVISTRTGPLFEQLVGVALGDTLGQEADALGDSLLDLHDAPRR